MKTRSIVFILITLTFIAVDVASLLIPSIIPHLKDVLMRLPLSAKLLSTFILIIILVWSFPYELFKKN